MRSAAVVAATLLLAGCRAADDRISVYFPQRLGADGPYGQVTPVLEPVEREQRRQMAPAWQALLELRQGPSPAERVRGFAPALAVAERPLAVKLDGDTAVVELADPPSSYGAAAIVYTLTELPHITRVGLRVRGKPCCFWTMDRSVEPFSGRARYRFWTGEPCELRTDETHARCRRDD